MVPLGLYDAHTVGTIAGPFSERLDQLSGTRGRDLPEEWAGFGETSWAIMKQGLLEAAADLEERNYKAEQIGLTAERLLAEYGGVDVWLDSAVHCRALQTHLLSAGFAVAAGDFEEGRIAIRTYSEAHGAHPSGRPSVFGSLPTSWQLPGALAAGVGGPSTLPPIRSRQNELRGSSAGPSTPIVRLGMLSGRPHCAESWDPASMTHRFPIPSSSASRPEHPAAQ